MLDKIVHYLLIFRDWAESLLFPDLPEECRSKDDDDDHFIF